MATQRGGVRAGGALVDPDAEAGAVPPPPAIRPSPPGSALAIVALIAIPVVVFGACALAGGHLLLTGDNLIQNYPLRVLVGSQLRHGVLPAWDPYIWSGTPLMAGLNAGVFFPTTLLFGIAPSHVAWVVGDIFVYCSVAVGAFLLFRSGGASPAACFLGACSFAFAGAVAAQTAVHVDMGSGLASLPWAVLAVRRIVEDGRWRWSILLGAALGLAVLAGSPEALLVTVAAAAAFGLLRWSVTRASAWPALSRLVAGAGLAAGATAFVWVPALRFIGESQRAAVTELAASGYSFPPRAAVLALVPYLEGGYRLFSQAPYFGPSNSGEVTFYVGVLPVIAGLALASRRWGTWLPRGERRCWYGLLAVGAVLAVGAGTPLEHVLYHIPFYGRQRDSGRNIVAVDLAASALFTWWVDGGFRPAGGATTPGRLERAGALVPLGLVLALGAWFALSPGTLWRALDATVSTPRPAGVAAGIGLAAAVAAACAAVALARHRLTPRWWLRSVSAMVLVDLALFSAGSAYLSSETVPEPGHSGPVIALVAGALSPGGRYAMFDPGLVDPTQLAGAGEPDVGILEQLPSVSGYGSIVDGAYANATETTARDYVDPGGIRSGRYADLGLQVVVTVPESFLSPVATLPVSGSPRLLPEPPGKDPALPGGNLPGRGLPVVPRTSPPLPPLTAGRVASWWFGTQLGVTEALLRFPAATGAETVRAGVLGAGGSSSSIRWGAARRLAAGSTVARFRLPGASGAGLAIEVLAGGPLGPVQPSVTAGSHAYLLDGELADTIVPGKWREVGAADDFVVFRSLAVPRQAWVARLASTGPGPVGATTRLVSASAAAMTLAVSSPVAARLVVSTAYDAGWHAEVTGAGGEQAVPVERFGLVEAVDVPAGSTSVTLTYRPVGFSTGLAISGGTLGALLLLCLAGLLQARRRARRPGPSRRRASR